MKKTFALLLFLSISTWSIAQPDGKALRHDEPSTEWEKAVKKRCDLMKDVSWTPLKTMAKVKKVKEAVFNAGEEQKGTPYSSVWDTHGFIGQDISFHTFLSAISNPMSRIYTVNYHMPPYNKQKAGPLYGSVCSSTVCYVWGLSAPFPTRKIRNGIARKYIEDLGNDISAVRLYDGICYNDPKTKKGHIMIFFDIIRDAGGNIVKASIFESTSPCARVKEYEIADLLKIVRRTDARYYRLRDEFRHGELERAPFMEQESIDLSLPGELCLEDGDAVSYPIGSTVRVNVLSDGYKEMVLYKDGEVVGTRKLQSLKTIEYPGLQEGLYEARLKKGRKMSVPTRFQICVTDCKLEKEGNKLKVTPFSKGVTPLYCTFRDKELTIVMFRKGDGSGTWIAEGIPEQAGSVSICYAGRYSSVLCPNKPL